MAAYAAVVSVMHLIHDIQHHHSPPISIHSQQLQSLSQILTSLQEFLEAYKSPVADADEADPLEMRIAGAAYAAEDIIESHIVEKIHLIRTHYQQTNPFFRAPRKPDNVDDEQTKSIKFYQDLQRVIEEMDLIKQEAMQIDTEKAVAVYDHNVSSSVPPFRSSSSSAMVCSDVVLLGIMEKLTRGRLDRQVIPIVGMGGIGKTTLAKTVYEHQLIKEHFDVCAWATISQQYNTREVLCEVLSQATNKKKEDLSEMSEDKLGSELYKYLFGRRFLIVMDDMWGIDAWENITHFFPNNENGSRILVTTRQSQLGSQLNTNYSHQMEFLDEDSSWDLFSKTVFGERNSYPHELEKIGKKIVNNCRGLPLSIVVVGGILKRMEHTPRCWESISNNLASNVNLENDKHCLRLLKLSYNHLPIYLKPCFLYMGVFEEDDQIRVSTLINLWISEGFLKPMNDRSMETIAMDILKDLVDRNLILIHMGSTGNIKKCRIHDLLRDLCLNEGQRDGFYHVIGRYSPQGINRQCRRIVIPRNTSKKKAIEEEELKYIPHARSVICKYGEVPRSQNFGLLRTLHAFNNLNSPKLNFHATQYVNLRHLAIEVHSLTSLFSSFHLFWNLHTLIVRCWNESYFSAEIWNMPQFRHIQISGWCLPDPPSDEDDDVVIMENLHILRGVKNLKCCEEVVKRIPNIKKLKISYDPYGFSNHDDPYCVSNIKSLCKLESLTVRCIDPKYRDAPYLHKLSFPHSLKSLTLGEFEWEAVLEKIGSLPHLEKLKLRSGWFRTGEWEIVEGQFSNLKYLELFKCYDLKQWKVEGSSVLPRLEKLRLSSLKELEEIPCEIGHITTLQKVKLINCSESAVKSAKEMVEEQVELQGDQLPFHVHVKLSLFTVLLGLADHNFTVTYL